jgi:leucyl-tRNA synthetase
MQDSIHEESWPAADESALVQTEIEIVIQINGRVRDRMCVPKGSDPEYLRESSLERVKESRNSFRIRVFVRSS